MATSHHLFGKEICTKEDLHSYIKPPTAAIIAKSAVAAVPEVLATDGSVDIPAIAAVQAVIGVPAFKGGLLFSQLNRLYKIPMGHAMFANSSEAMSRGLEPQPEVPSFNFTDVFPTAGNSAAQRLWHENAKVRDECLKQQRSINNTIDLATTDFINGVKSNPFLANYIGAHQEIDHMSIHEISTQIFPNILLMTAKDEAEVIRKFRLIFSFDQQSEVQASHQLENCLAKRNKVQSFGAQGGLILRPTEEMDATRNAFASNIYFKQAWDAYQITNPLATPADYINLCRSAAKSMDITNDWRTKHNPFSANEATVEINADTPVDDGTTDLSMANAVTKKLVTTNTPTVHARPKKINQVTPNTTVTERVYSTVDLVDFLYHGVKNPNGQCKFHQNSKTHTASQCSEFVKYRTRLGGT